jgi:hypothetical protein
MDELREYFDQWMLSIKNLAEANLTFSEEIFFDDCMKVLIEDGHSYEFEEDTEGFSNGGYQYTPFKKQGLRLDGYEYLDDRSLLALYICEYSQEESIQKLSQTVIDQLLNHKFFAQKPPKSLDRAAFGFLTESVKNLSLVDAAATLTHAVARSVALSLDHLPSPPREIWITGGGRKNLEIMRLLSAGLPMAVHDINELGFDGDMVEAQAFAYLAARVLHSLPTSFPLTTGVPLPVIGGKISAAS